MSRRIRRDLHKRVGASGYQQIAGDLEVSGRILGPSITNLATAISRVSTKTSVAAKLPMPTAEPGVRSVILRWEKQYTLNTPSHYNVAVGNNPAGPKYIPCTDGTNWGFGEGSLPVVGEMYIHTNIPNVGGEDDPHGRTIYYWVQQETKSGALSEWSEPVEVTTKTVGPGDIAANSVYANTIVAQSVTAMHILASEIAGLLLHATSAVIIGQDYEGTPPAGAQRVVCDDNELRLDERSEEHTSELQSRK